jgi:hypothetical protein
MDKVSKAIAEAVRSVDPTATAISVEETYGSIVTKRERVEFESGVEEQQREAAIRKHFGREALPVSGDAKRNLAAAGIETYDDVDRVGMAEVAKVKGVGPKTLEAIAQSRDASVAILLAIGFDPES